MEIKQIEVNGTTYDIGIPGSDLSIICETCGVHSSVPTENEVLEALDNKHSEESDSYHYTYTPVPTLHFFIRERVESDATISEKTIVMANVEYVDESNDETEE